MRNVVLVTGILVVLALSVVAQANPLTSTFTGSGSGTLAGVPFPLSNFVITAVGDTSERQVPYANVYVIDNISASISIESVGTFTFLTPTLVFCNANLPGVGFSADLDLFNIPYVPQFSTWDMTTSIGPVIAQSGALDQWDHSPINTSGGVLWFADRFDTPCTFTAEVVPEPSSMITLAGGLAGLLGFRRRRS